MPQLRIRCGCSLKHVTLDEANSEGWRLSSDFTLTNFWSYSGPGWQVLSWSSSSLVCLQQKAILMKDSKIKPFGACHRKSWWGLKCRPSFLELFSNTTTVWLLSRRYISLGNMVRHMGGYARSKQSFNSHRDGLLKKPFSMTPDLGKMYPGEVSSLFPACI